MTTHQFTGEEIVLEEYDFNLEYCQPLGDGTHKAHKEPLVNGVKITKQSLKEQANKFVRALIEFSATLEDVPEHRWITLQLAYMPETPTDYQPVYFTDATYMDLPAMSSGNAINVTIGKVQTPHHGLGMQFKGVEHFDDLLESDIPIRTKGPKSTFRGSSIPRSDAPAPVSSTDPSKMHCTPPTDGDNSTDGSIEQDFDSTYSIIRDFILKEGKSVMQQCIKSLSLRAVDVKSIFVEMVQDGFLIKTGNGYKISHKNKKTQSSTAAAQTSSTSKRAPPSAPRKIFPDTTDDMEEEATMQEDDYDEHDPRANHRANIPALANTAQRNLSKLTPELSQQQQQQQQSSVVALSSIPLREKTTKQKAAQNRKRANAIVVPDTNDESQEATWREPSPEVELFPPPHPPPAKRAKISIIKDPLHLHGINNLGSQNSYGESGDRADYSYSQ